MFADGQTASITDFKSLEYHGGRRPRKHRMRGQDKGQSEMLKQFFACASEGARVPIAIDEQIAVSKTCFAVLESLRTSKTITL